MAAPLLPPILVNGVEIPPAAIAAEAQNHPAPPGKPGMAWRAAARALVLRQLMLEAARGRGLVASPQSLGPGQVESDDEALIRALIEAELQPAAPDTARLRAAHAANPDRYRAPDLWQAAHILIPHGPKARALADELAAVLARSPGRFAELAAAHSACPSARSGGSLGQIGPGETVAEFQAALASLAPGQITPAPVETRYGFHLIRLDDHAPGAVLPFEAVAARMEDAARKAAWARAARDFAARLLAEARVEGLAVA